MRKIYRDKGLLLIPLPGNKGLNVGRNFTGNCTIRNWPMALYDFADHVSVYSKHWPWAEEVLGVVHECPRCRDKSKSVLLDSDGEPYLCDECWDDN